MSEWNGKRQATLAAGIAICIAFILKSCFLQVVLLWHTRHWGASTGCTQEDDFLLPAEGGDRHICAGELAVGQIQMGPAKQQPGRGSLVAVRGYSWAGDHWLTVLTDRHATVLDDLLLRCQILSKIGLCFKVMYSKNFSQKSEQIWKTGLYPQDMGILRI